MSESVADVRKRVFEALYNGEKVRVETPGGSEWTFETDKDDKVVAVSDRSKLRYDEAAIQRLEGWLAQVDAEHYILESEADG